MSGMNSFGLLVLTLFLTIPVHPSTCHSGTVKAARTDGPVFGLVFVKSCHSDKFIPIYADSAMTIPATNPQSVDAAGRYRYFDAYQHERIDILYYFGSEPLHAVTLSTCEDAK